jgi:flagellar basal-body rod protein FlgB
MPLNLDTYLGVHQDALKLYAQRTAVLANNIANADTPNYKAQDIDFRTVLAGTAGAAATAGTAAGGGPAHKALPLSTTNGAHVAGAAVAAGGAAPLKYRVPLAPSLDGNTVDVQLEQAAFADNSVRYQAALGFLSSKFKELMTAITGQ